ncbi:sensor histidine kinase [Parabacteroides sp. AM58-2XD]|uniref:ATP-binding protein n=2 Tax=Parabacteroides TaxID=375288 RepID=UPI000FE1D2B1|nr:MULTISPECIES: ATP-binding protein [Parabacteroides]RGY93893.1 sensor histidine kinase [Parabacteroides sp. AM58-2XD]GKG73380.1 two-component sensor histidine kinase [Parabacteroides goldsteinii]GKG79315.1 two-component sensor histidine kinase [Parabacteroides goldsteinii]
MHKARFRQQLKLGPLCLFCILCIFICIKGAATNRATRLDSLKDILSHSPSPDVAIKTLQELSDLYRQKPEEVGYLHRLLDIGNRVDSVQAVYAAAANLSRYYYDDNKSDSVVYWAKYIDSVGKSRKELSDGLFEAYSYVCLDHLWLENYELAMNEAIRLYNLACSRNHTYGQIRCGENLGHIYQAIRRDSDAVVVYQAALDKQEEIGENLTVSIRLVSYQLESLLRINKLDSAGVLLATYKNLLDRQEAVNKNTGAIYPVDRYRWIMHSFYAEYYLKRKDFEKARKSLDCAESFVGKETIGNDFAVFAYLYIQARYNKEVGNYAVAHKYIDQLLESWQTPDCLQLKADILSESGDAASAIQAYKDVISETSKINNEAFTRQINQLRTLYDLNDKEIQKKELEISQMNVNIKEHQLILSMSVSVILLLVLYILYLSFRRTRRLKNALLQEKEALIESEKNLRIAKDKAEEANQAKTTFIANISHEVRTPLNAIVGFASLMSDPSCTQEEKEEFSSIISNNTELLLNLVNDVLCLSQIEAGSLSFSLRPVELGDCCRNAMETIRHRVAEGVSLNFTPEVPSFILNTDPLRLQQLLVNLLVNAAKFTEAGEINLSFHIGQEQKNVDLIVTDTGCGIPADKVTQIFKRFEKVDEYKQGTGLGLSISQAIAGALGGTIRVDAGYTQGARFIFTHPC